MQFLFPSDKQIELSFKVGIAGTSNSPQNVSVILEKNSTSLNYTAQKDGDNWVAIIDSPGKMFGAGEVNLSISVSLNNRVFTPMKGVAEITNDAPTEVPTEQPVVEPTIQPTIKPDIQPVVVPHPVKEQVKPDFKKVIPKPIKEAPKPPEKLQLLKSIEPGRISPKKEAPKPIIQETVTTSAFRIKRGKIIFK